MRPSARAMIGVRRMQIEMPLPDLIEIVPLSAAPEVEITVPGSKRSCAHPRGSGRG